MSAADRRAAGSHEADHPGAVSALAVALHAQAGWKLQWAAALVLASGLLLLLLELADGRIRLPELAGAVILLKLGLAALMACKPGWAAPLFWLLLFVSALSSHAPRDLRHWPSPPSRGRVPD